MGRHGCVISNSIYSQASYNEIELYLRAVKISCSAELSMKKGFITLGPVQHVIVHEHLF